MTRTTVTSSFVGRGRLMRRFTIILRIVEEEVNRIKQASRRKRKAQNRPETPRTSGTDMCEKPISETVKKKRRTQGGRSFCKRAVMAISPGKNWVRCVMRERITAPESNQR